MNNGIRIKKKIIYQDDDAITVVGRTHYHQGGSARTPPSRWF